MQKLLTSNPIRAQDKSPEPIIESIPEIIDNRFEHKWCLESQEFARYLNLIKTRDLKRKPIAYLNARHPLNDISRSIYAGIATKKSVLDFPSVKRKIKSEEGVEGVTKRRKLFEREVRDVEEEEEGRNEWAFVLKSLDFCSPLSQRIVGVLPQFQFKCLQ